MCGCCRCCCCRQPSKMSGLGPKQRGSACFWRQLQPFCLPVEIGRPCCRKHCSKPRICSAEAQMSCSEQTAQDSRTGGPMQLLAAQGRMAGQIASKTPKQRPTNWFLVPVRTALTKRTPSATGPLSGPVRILSLWKVSMIELVCLLWAQTLPGNVQRISNWIRPCYRGPVQAPSAASLRIQFPP